MEATTLQSEAPARLKEGVVVHPEAITLQTEAAEL
jgi:hypothetical protein